MRRFLFIITPLILVHGSLFAWGGVTHKFINKNAVTHLPPSMSSLAVQAPFLEAHASDPDNRGGLRHLDTNFYGEYWRHFLDLDNYPNYANLSSDLFGLVSLHGRDVVRKNGTSWWATVWVMDSLTAQVKRGDTARYQTASDLGHYVGDMHQPLHATGNYDGQFSGNKGIHSRYESTMMGKYIGSVSIVKDSVKYIKDPMTYIFGYILESNSYTDSVMAADRYAAPPSGYNGSGTLPTDYYQKLWERTAAYTKQRVQKATVALASLWYTAYINAGAFSIAQVRPAGPGHPAVLSLEQNYPNPFNPSTSISFAVAKAGRTSVEIFTADGRSVGVLVDQWMEPGRFRAEWNAASLPSGTYFCRLQAGGSSVTKKMLLLK